MQDGRDQHGDLGRAFRLGEALIEPRAHEIVVGGARRRVRRKLMQGLVLLASRRHEVVTREELLEHLWPHRIASDESVTQLVSELRRVLGPVAQVETVPGRGYRLIAPDAPAMGSASMRVGARAELAATDRRWGLALLLGMFVAAQALMLLLGGGHHH